METQVWELYEIIKERGPKYCAKKCLDLLDHCEEYILTHVSKDDWKPLRSFEGKNGAKAATFATTVIVNLVLSCLRSLKDTVTFDDTHEVYTNIPIFQILMYDEVSTAIQQLDEMDRLMIILFYYDGYSAEEIAAMMNCSASDLHANIHKKLLEIADHLQLEESELFAVEIPPKKLASLQESTAKQIHKKIENAMSRLKKRLNQDGEKQ